MRKKIVAFVFAMALVVAMAVPLFGSGTAWAHGFVTPPADPVVCRDIPSNDRSHVGLDVAENAVGLIEGHGARSCPAGPR